MIHAITRMAQIMAYISTHPIDTGATRSQENKQQP